ncbi:MAG TPA: hypothetical protein VIC85_18930 [Ktedonobacterales bacterium]|jgi:hypothetical protein
MRWVILIIGILAIAFGLLWTLQGLNIVRGGFMSGHIQYTVLGVVVGIIGIVLVVTSARRRAPKG